MTCREQEVTRLVRVDVSTSANGVLAVALSEQEKGFAPYRLDNCTGLKLHLRYSNVCRLFAWLVSLQSFALAGAWT